jgi:hypothetical protein
VSCCTVEGRGTYEARETPKQPEGAGKRTCIENWKAGAERSLCTRSGSRNQNKTKKYNDVFGPRPVRI